MFFEADSRQIEQLTSLQLVELLKRLILAECRVVDIPLHAASVPLQITVADGGEDARVNWQGGLDSTNFFPARFCVFQSKAQNLTATSMASEVLKKPQKGAKKLNAAILKAIAKRGAYVVFCSRGFGEQKVDKLRKAIEKAIHRGKRNPKHLRAIEIYDANRIAAWVDAHPPVALWLASLKRGRSLAGFQSHEAWGRDNEIANIPWVADDTLRFLSNSSVNIGTESHRANREAWSFTQAADIALDYLSKDHAVLRIAGPSGFGKSRFSFELFNRRKALSDEFDRTAVIYADLQIAGDEIGKLALEIADAGSPTILVVDECPDDLHVKLAGIARRTGSRLRLLTIDVETKVQDSEDSMVIRLEPASDETIGLMVKAVAPKLSYSDSRYIQELSKGFPKMAVLAARQHGTGRQAITSAEEVLTRVVWGRRQRIDEAQKSLELLSLFEWVGLTGPVADEGEFVAERLGGITRDAFVAHIKSFSSRGVILKRSDYAQVTPIPLAASLGANLLTLLSTETLSTFFMDATASLRNSLLRRMRWFDTTPEAKAFARSLLASSCLGNLETLNTDSGSEYIDHLVHVDPDAVMTTIHRLIGSLTPEELQQITAGRRHLVWALEKLVFRRQSFDTAATLLCQLAASETEGGIVNNATGQFTQLYQLHLAGTEASPEIRLLVLDDGLRSPNQKKRGICITALSKMLETGHFSRGGGAEEIGSQAGLKDWAPSTYGEIWDFYRAALHRLTDIALSNDPFASQAKNIIGSHIRGLIGRLPFDEIKATIYRIVSHDGFWPEAIEKVNEWLYFDRKEAPKELGQEVRAYFNELMPIDPVELAILHTHGWQADFHDPDTDYEQEQASQHDFEYSTRKAIELADVVSTDQHTIDRALDRFVTSQGKSVFPFARRLAEVTADPRSLFKSAIEKAELRQEPPNLDFFSGLIAGIDSRDSEVARDCIRLALNSLKLKENAISMIGSSKLQPSDITLVASLLLSGDVKPWQCATLSYGKRMSHLEALDILPLLDALSQNGPHGLLAAVDIITMILHGGEELTGELLSVLKDALVDPRLFEAADHSRMMGSNVERIIGLLVRRKLIDLPFAQTLINQLLSICTPLRNNIFHELSGSVRNSLRALIPLYPREVWTSMSKLLIADDHLIRHRIDWLLRRENDDHQGPGFLSDLPESLYLDWARKDPLNRASIVMKWLPVTIKNDAGDLEWHPTLRSFISEFGDQDNVLGTLSSRLHPLSWWGPLFPHLQPQLKLLESWLTHPSPKIRQWARDRINWINTNADD